MSCPFLPTPLAERIFLPLFLLIIMLIIVMAAKVPLVCAGHSPTCSMWIMGRRDPRGEFYYPHHPHSVGGETEARSGEAPAQRRMTATGGARIQASAARPRSVLRTPAPPASPGPQKAPLSGRSPVDPTRPWRCTVGLFPSGAGANHAVNTLMGCRATWGWEEEVGCLFPEGPGPSQG